MDVAEAGASLRKPRGCPGPMLLLPEVLDFRAAAPLAAELTAHRGQDVTVDASRVRRLGAQCLQVLLSARTCWEHEGAQFSVVATSGGFADGLALLGATCLFPPTRA